MKSGENMLGYSTEELDEIVSYLERHGVRRDWIGYVMSQCPQLFLFLPYCPLSVSVKHSFLISLSLLDPECLGRKPTNVNSSVAKPEAESPATKAEGPGIGMTGIFSFTNAIPGSLMPGVPASLI